MNTVEMQLAAREPTCVFCVTPLTDFDSWVTLTHGSKSHGQGTMYVHARCVRDRVSSSLRGVIELDDIPLGRPR